MEGREAWGRLRRRLDSERTHARQAEARLRQHLQRLERACRSHLRLLSWEQRQLRGERERLQRNLKSKGPSSSGGGCQQRPADAALRPARGGRRGGAPRASGLRAPATASPTQGTHKNGCREPPPCPTGLKDPVESQEPSPPSPSSAASDAPEGDPAGRATPTEPAHPDPGASPAGDRGGVRGEEAGSGDASRKPDHSAGEPTSPRATGCEGDPSSEASASSLRELFARAAHARYLRLRAPPESERELSLAEIFGHRGPGAPPGRASSQSPPL
ncbi:coiled-coil domain-containing protein 190 [Phyllostomus hastatus]|uniref:coiled-coil domain-containing protein 190 n=1 Tax=Phyllostomus hastatus TaxID=9423 RepID=UPI001E681CB1|nr:coiled-coil domain-containing protein 190 [Phyllostomus hastatus]